MSIKSVLEGTLSWKVKPPFSVLLYPRPIEVPNTYEAFDFGINE